MDDELYLLPCAAKKINIYIIKLQENMCAWPITDIDMKMWHIKDNFHNTDLRILIPLRHGQM